MPDPASGQGMYFYSDADFEGDRKFYPVEKIVSYEAVPFPAKSYKNISQLAVFGYAIRDMSQQPPELAEYMLNADGDLDPPVIIFGIPTLQD
ncbi:MAG: hypothetical protein ACRDRI_03960 [Pseudonocardiaceae bacterium]